MRRKKWAASKSERICLNKMLYVCAECHSQESLSQRKWNRKKKQNNIGAHSKGENATEMKTDWKALAALTSTVAHNIFAFFFYWDIILNFVLFPFALFAHSFCDY